jgi:hypothetical protein
MRRLFFLIVPISLAVPTISQSKHPFTFEDMMKLKRVGEPEVSLDGKWVIFSVAPCDPGRQSMATPQRRSLFS